MFQYESVSAPGGVCFVVLAPTALDEPLEGLDSSRQGWVCTPTRDHVMMMSELDSTLRFEWSWS